MINDPLHEAIVRRREARRPQSSEAPEPEGVTLYRCQALIALEEPASEYDESVLHKVGCGRTVEAKPYAAIPICHGAGMAIAGYDWDRDV